MKNGKKLLLLTRLTWQTAPLYVLLLMIHTVTAGIQILCNVIFPRFLVDELTGGQSGERLILYGCLIVGSNLFFAWISRLVKRYMDVQNQYMNQKMEQLLGEKIMKLPYEKLEDPRCLDLKERAVFAMSGYQAMLTLITQMSELLKNGVTLLGLTAVLLTLSPVLVMLLTALVGAMLLTQKNFAGYQKKIMEYIIPINRRYGYYVNLTFDDERQKDFRLYDMGPMLGKRITDYNQEILKEFNELYAQKGICMGLYGVINDLQAAIAYGYVGLRVLTDWFGTPVSLGAFTMYVSAAVRFSAGITKLGESVITVTQLLGYLDPFMELMSLPDEEEQTRGLIFNGPVESIVFEHVDFAYPGTRKKVLEDISFSVKKGEKISVAGVNGAGKSTLIKLLCRLYRPASGRILINGHDIFDYDYSSYMREVAAVFQDYRLFAFSIEENISCRAPGQAEEKVEELAGQVGLLEKLSELPQGIHTLLGKAYDENGTELSGGQCQKIAIARALYKDASLIILDEPTSALDPLAEAEIYEHFNQLAGGRTALYISHRMSSSIFCDKVLVIDGGRAADYASHEELMKKKDSRYCQLFTAQAENYAVSTACSQSIASPENLPVI